MPTMTILSRATVAATSSTRARWKAATWSRAAGETLSVGRMGRSMFGPCRRGLGSGGEEIARGVDEGAHAREHVARLAAAVADGALVVAGGAELAREADLEAALEEVEPEIDPVEQAIGLRARGGGGGLVPA